MSQSDKSAYFQALKAAGVKFDRHYREYSTAELKAAYNKLQETTPGLAPNPPAPQPKKAATPPPSREDFDRAVEARARELAGQTASQPKAPVPVREKDPNELAGQRQRSLDEPIRTDEQGRVWYQEEVLKPAYPKPRGRRVLDYMETGTKTVDAQNGEYRETFEVAGDEAARPAQVKITLPSYQVGIYKDPRFPFKVITYNGNDGFDLAEVQKYYGGSELVPAEVKRKYVENVLCYDIRTVVRAIQTEFRQMQLQGKA